MRFIFNFIFFGLFFFILWQYFPDAFHTLVTWAAKTVEFFQSVFQSIYDKIAGSTEAHQAAHDATKAAS